MKAFRFCSLMALAILITAGLTACSSDDKEFMDNESVASYKGDVVKGISVSLSDFVSAGAETRTAYSATDGGVKVTWASNDTIGIFPNVGGQVEFPIEAGTASNQATFDGGGWALKSNSTYAAYYPYSAKNSYYTNKTIQVDFTGQKQTANGKTSHLSQYDYQATSGVTTNSSGYLNFQFKHLGALMVFQLTVPKAGTYTSLTLTSTEKVFVTKAELDISGNEPMLKNASKSNTFTLKLGDIALEADNSVLTAYMMLAPADLSQGSLELTIYGDRIFTTTLDGHNLEAGKQYTIEKSVVDDTPSPDEIINFADDEVKAICIENWDTNKDGELSYKEAATVTDIGNKFYAKTKIKSFDEFQYFTGVTSIGGSAFFNCSKLTSIVIPEGVTSIGNSAFYSCSSLTSIEIPEGVTSIGFGAFRDCSSLTSIEIPEGVTSIGISAFSGCSRLTSIVIPEGMTSIEDDIFSSCSSLTSIEIPEGVTSIGISAFSGCSKLNSIVIPESVTSIGGSAFRNCSNLTNIEIPEGVTSIGNSAFSGCSSLTSFSVPKGITRIDFLYGCTNLTSINIPEGVKEVYLDNCTSLKSIKLPEGVTSISFDGCSSLKSVKLPEGVTSISFGHCSSLTSMVIPESVTSIGVSAFNGCSSLTSVVILEGVTSIGGYAFYGCSSLTSMVIPEGVTSIDHFAFYGCNSLTSIVIPEGVTSIGNHVFYNCSSLTSIVIPESVTSIGISAFNGCSRLTSVVIPEGVTSIGGYAFSGCSSLTNIEIPEGVTSIGNSAFSGCSSLTSFTCLAVNPPTFEFIFGNDIYTGPIYVPATSVEAYKAAWGWKDYASKIQAIPE